MIRRPPSSPLFPSPPLFRSLLVQGFEHPPLILTPHNPPYYERLWVDGGWEQTMDLWGWRFERASTALSERQRRVLDRLKARDRKSTRLNSSHLVISYAVFCL